MVLGIHENFQMVLNWFYVSRFSDLEQDYASQENMENEQLATCKRESENTVGTYYGNKDEWFIGH